MPMLKHRLFSLLTILVLNSATFSVSAQALGVAVQPPAGRAHQPAVIPADLTSQAEPPLRGFTQSKLNGLAQQAYLKPINTDTGDLFGFSVATSGDTIAIGAMFEDNNSTGVNGDPQNGLAQNSGAVYVFVRAGDVWNLQAYLKASNTDPGDFFGSNVAILDDTLVVGAHGEKSSATGINGNQFDNSSENAGAAYVFTREGGIWTQQAYLKASNTGKNDNFGADVAIYGDMIVIGASGESSASTGVDGDPSDDTALLAGAVYVFTRVGRTWAQQAYIKASDTAEGDGFGEAVALFKETLVVGAPQEDGDRLDDTLVASGAVYVFTLVNGRWAQNALLRPSNPGTNDCFGIDVSIWGDTILVGANGESSGAIGVNGDGNDDSLIQSGAAYVYLRINDGWYQHAYLKASNPGINHLFGTTLAIVEDTAFIGSPWESGGSMGINGNQDLEKTYSSGAVYAFYREGSNWTQVAYIKASNTGKNDSFGASVAFSADTLVVGAYGEASSATGINGNQADNTMDYAGAAYVFIGINRGFLPFIAR